MAGETAVRGDEAFGLTPNSAQDEAAAAAAPAKPAPAGRGSPGKTPAAQQDVSTGLRPQEGTDFDREFELDRNEGGKRARPAPATRTTTVRGGEAVEEGEEEEQEEHQDEEHEEGEEEGREGEPQPGEREEPSGAPGEGEEGEPAQLTDAVGELTLEERQQLLDALLTGDEADELELTYLANDAEQRERWFDVRKKAAGYAGEEQASAQLARERAALKQEGDQIKARATELAAHLQDPKKLYAFLEEQADDPLSFFKGFVELAQKYIEDIERDPASYRFDRSLRRRDRTIGELVETVKKLAGGRGEREGREAEDGDGERTPRELTRVEIDKIIEQRTRLVEQAGLDPVAVGKAYAAAGKPEPFEGWLKRHAEEHRRSRALRENRDQRARGGAPVRRTGGAPAGGGGGKRPVPAGAWPSASEIAKDVEGMKGRIGRRR